MVAATLDEICAAAYQGDVESLQQLLKDFNGSLDTPFTDVTALHMAAIGGKNKSVELLLKAGANPHTRQTLPCNEDPNTGKTAKDMATAAGHKALAKSLEKAEKSTPKPEAIKWSQPTGEPEPVKAAPKAKAEAKAEPNAKAEAFAKAKANFEPKAKAEPKAEPKAKAKAEPKVAPAPAQDTLPIALLFPGQGSQCVGMLKAVKDIPEVQDMLTKAEEILGYDLLQLCLEGPEEKLGETRYTQPAMFVAGLAGVAKLRTEREEAVTRAQCAAGLSLGEYTALCFAGVLSFEDGLKLVKLRGEAMQEAAAVGKQGMLSVIGLEQKALEKLCNQAAKETGGVCKIANFLFPKGFSCAGTEEAIDVLEKKATAAKALKATKLKTSGGFHTSLMQPAAEKLAKALEDTLPNMKPNKITVYSNVTAEALPPGTEPAVIVELLKKQLCNSVLWDPSVQRMMKDGLKEYYECGPNKQIKAMMKRIDNAVWKSTKNVEV